MNEKIKQSLETALAGEEHVLWEGETQPFKLLDGKEGRRTLLQWIAGTAAKLFPVKPGAAIAIGAAVVEEGDRQLRWRSLHALENPGQFDGCNASGLVFYNAARAESAVKLILEKAEAAQRETK